MMDIETALTAVKAAAKTSKRPVYKRAFKLLSKKVNQLAEVNVGKLDLVSSDGGVILVPGKVLGEGFVTKKMHVGAVAFTASAAQKIREAGGEALLMKDFVARFGEGKEVLLVGG